MPRTAVSPLSAAPARVRCSVIQNQKPGGGGCGCTCECLPLSVQEACVCGTGSAHWEGHSTASRGCRAPAPNPPNQVTVEEEGLPGRGGAWVSSGPKDSVQWAGRTCSGLAAEPAEGSFSPTEDGSQLLRQHHGAAAPGARVLPRRLLRPEVPLLPPGESRQAVTVRSASQAPGHLPVLPVCFSPGSLVCCLQCFSEGLTSQRRPSAFAARTAGCSGPCLLWVLVSAS